MKKSLAHLPQAKADEVAKSLRRSRRRLRQSQPRNTLNEIRNTNHCPQEHHLDILADLAADYCPQLKGIIPHQTKRQKDLFELLDYAYIGARYDREYKITKEQLEQLAPCVVELHELTEKICKEKIESL
jgi:hypothetical protein